MCSYSEKLVAWIDGELAEHEATGVERHVQGCAQCQASINAYEDASRLFVTYCEMRAAATPARKMPRWVPALVGTAAAAGVLLLIFGPASVKRAPVAARVAGAAPAVVAEASPAQANTNKTRRRARKAALPSGKADWAIAEPEVQIAIPADAMFPPGAIPEGITFIAEVSMASDGSVQGLRLQQ